MGLQYFNPSLEIHINPNQLVFLPVSIFCLEQISLIIPDALMESLWKIFTNRGEIREKAYKIL